MNTDLFQIKGDVWRKAFSDFLKYKNIKTYYYPGSTYPADEWEGEDWYKDQLVFDEECGIKRYWLNDYLSEDLYGYDIIDRKKFLLAKVRYGF